MLQRSIHEILEQLDPELAQDPAQVESFIADASVKANVAHPYIFAVYEAGQAGGFYFYSCEYMPCRSVRQIVEAGQFLDEMTAVQAMKVAAETLGYFYQNNIAHNLITAGTLLIAGNNKPRLANIAAYQPSSTYDQQQEMIEVGNIVASALPENSQKLGIRQLATDLATRAVPLLSILKRAAAAHAEIMWEGKGK